MGSILIANPKVENANRVKSMLQSVGIGDQMIVCRTGAQILEALETREADLIICPRRLSDMTCEELLNYLPAYVNMILITADSSFSVYAPNVIRLSIPFRAGDLINTISMLRGPARIRKKAPPKRNAGEQKLIDDAKQLLMERNSMTEPEAFRYIQKTSMDTGRSMVESAQMILLLNSE